jgi:hypothetical protein
MLGFIAAAVLIRDGGPLLRAHAHNDYAQPRPFAGALELGFCSIEADVYLVDGKLLVGHDRKDLKPERTLDAMYLHPLSLAVKANRGNVYKEHAEVILLVDIKADGAAVYEELKRELKPYDSWLTRYVKGKVRRKAVTVILSGERPTDVLAKEESRTAFIDGRPEDLSRSSPTLVPLISASWDSLFTWNGSGEMSSDERQRLAGLVSACHAKGQKLRFWATQDSKAMWQVLFDAGVDLIGTDRQKDLAGFLHGQ